MATGALVGTPSRCAHVLFEIDVEIRIAQDGNVKIEAVKDEDRPGNLDALFNMDEDVDKATTEKNIEAKEKVLKEKSNADLVDEFAEKVCIVFQKDYGPHRMMTLNHNFQIDTNIFPLQNVARHADVSNFSVFSDSQ